MNGMTFRHIRSMIGTEPRLYVALGVLRFLIFGGAPWASGLVLKTFFDQLSGSAPAGLTPLSLAGLLVLIAILRGLAVLLDLTGVYVFNFLVAARFRTNLLERILERPGAQAVPHSAGEAVSRFRDDTREVAHFANNALLFVLAESVFVLLALAVMLQISVPITLAVFAPLVVAVGLANQLIQRIVFYRKASREAAGAVTGFIGELFGAVQAVQLAAAEERVLQHFAQINQSRREVALKDRLYTELFDSVLNSTVNLGTGIILLAAAGAMRDGSFSIGDFALFVAYLSPTTGFVSSLGRLLARKRQADVSWNRMVELLQGAPVARLLNRSRLRLFGPEPVAVQPLPVHQPLGAANQPLLRAQGLSFGYPAHGRGIHAVDLELGVGELVVVTGRIGSGKTTLLRVLLGLLPRSAGQIWWNGTLVDDPGSVLVPPRCAYTAQTPRLFSDSLRQNILLGLPEQEVNLPGAIHAAVLEEDLQHLPDGLDAMVGSRGVRLSGGQVQRTAAARMFVRQPDLLVFDDLSSALDVETEQQLWERLAAQRIDPAFPQTILAVSHRRGALQRATRIIILEEGQVADMGTLEELLERSVLMRRLWQMEAHE